MAKMESTVVIARPVEEVFNFFLNLEISAPKTDPSVGTVIKTPDGPAGPGTTFRFRQQNLGKVRETTTRFTAIEPNRRIAFEAEIGPMRPQCDLIRANRRRNERHFPWRLHPTRPPQVALSAGQHQG